MENNFTDVRVQRVKRHLEKRMYAKETFQALFHVFFRLHLKTGVNTSIHAVSHST